MAEDLYVTQTGMVVDPARFKRNGETLMFTPFVVGSTRTIGDAIREDAIPLDWELLVAVRDEQRVVALSRAQMAYHHVAQGTIDGEPWAVFF
jgi:hypothetical protein